MHDASSNKEAVRYVDTSLQPFLYGTLLIHICTSVLPFSAELHALGEDDGIAEAAQAANIHMCARHACEPAVVHAVLRIGVWETASPRSCPSTHARTHTHTHTCEASDNVLG